MAKAALATAYVQVMPSFDGFRRQVEAELGSSMKAATPAAARAGEDAGRAFGGGFTRLAGAALAALGGVALLDFGRQAVQAFSEVEDATSALTASFGASGQALVDWAQSSGDALNVSQAEALKAAQTFAIFGETAGLAGQQLVDFSSQLVTRAADMASYFGGTTTDAIEAVGAALRGESEPIRRYGVLLDDATLRAKALELGLVSATANALTPQQRVLAAQAVVLEQTSRAQGDVERTSGSMGNKIKDAQQKWADFQAQVGQAASAVAGPLLDALSVVTGAATGLGRALAAVPAPIQAVALAIGGLVAASRSGILAGLGAAIAKVGQAAGTAVVAVRSLGTAWQYAGEAAARAYGPAATFSQRVAEMGRIIVGTRSVMGSFRSALGGLVAALGGPWAMALSAAAVALGFFMKAQADAKAAVQELTATLDEQTGAATQLSAAKISEAMRLDVSPGDIALAERYGASIKDAVQAVIDGPEAVERYNLQLRAYADAARAAGDTRAVEAIQGIQASMKNQNEVMVDARDAWQAHNAALQDAADLGYAVADSTDTLGSSAASATGFLDGMEQSLLGIGYALGLIPKTAPWSTWEAFDSRGQSGDPALRGYIRSESDQQAYDAAMADQASRDEQAATDEQARRDRLQAERAQTDQARINLDRQFWSDERRARKERDEALATLRAGPQSGEVFLANQRAYYEKEYAYRAAHRARLDAEARADQQRADEEAAAAERRAQEREAARQRAEEERQRRAEERRRAMEEIRTTVNARTWLGDLIGGSAESATTALIDNLLPQVLALLPAGMGTGFAEWLAKQNAALGANIAAREEIAKKLDKANQDLADAIAARDTAAKSFKDSAIGNITEWGKTPASIKRWLSTRLAAMKTFASNLKVLAARGLPLTFLRQILAAGIDGGSQVAAALMRANDGDWAQIVSQATELETTADVLGKDLAGQLYQGAVDSAQAIVDGLESQKAALEAEAQTLGTTIRDGILAGLGGTIQVGISGGVTEARPGRTREARPTATGYAAAAGKTFAPTVIVNNPVAEPTSTSLPRALRRTAWEMGV